ncbi:hypothetical protein SUGI_0010170 [Cryptomeria japonica]|uniref:uncharacterized protein LOC131041927 n=1 Tax=Cryptomeria japonica TaxID=3369 RepID=UPI002408DCEE|nr:uncharacterized protein LOC131041927 [Cryptomeria japonica]GLJ05052.1 hypothetical protein SUGI_0010170 [Cryptomeria japonica]
MPGYPLNESMLSGFFFDGRKVSPSPPGNWPLQVSNSSVAAGSSSTSSRQIFAGGKLKHKAACRVPSQSQASRLLNGFGRESDEPSNRKCSSDESENDLAAMVHDFIENGNSANDFTDQAEKDVEAVNILELKESLQALVSGVTSHDRDLFSSISTILVNISAVDLVGQSTGANCNGSCIRQLLVKNLKLAGYDAALCKVKWNNSGRVPGGEHEYIDVVADRSSETSDRIIIDTDFRSQFEIARPVSHYQATLKLLPVIFIDKALKLEQILQIMCKAAKCSLKQNAMPVPPWRTLEYTKAKWFSAYQRCINSREEDHIVSKHREVSCSKRCEEQLVHLKSFLKKESADAGYTTLKSITNRGKIFMRAKPSCWS